MCVEMQQIDSFSLTYDGWTDLQQEQYISLMAHGITPKWELKSFLLELHPVKLE